LNRLGKLFAGDRKALVAYLCVGDPSVEETTELARVCVRAGADAVELGVPFSDPTADGPAIARASQRAIANGGGLAAALRVAGGFRAAEPDAGLVLFGYYNPLFVRDEKRAVLEAAAAGVDALLVVDLPAQESGPLRLAASACGLGIIPLLAPTSSADRIATTARFCADGSTPFVYYVSVTGVTGSTALNASEAGARAGQLQKQLGRPVVVGFGIDSRQKAREAGAEAAGVVVGTALVSAIERGHTKEARRNNVSHLVEELRAGLDELEV
jgi:tryptophan synthase alpha chain